MTWLKVDDKLTFNAKILRAKNAAVGAWVRMGAWCAERETDGVLPPDVVELIASPDELAKCIEVKLVHVRDDGSFEVNDYLKYNPSRAQLQADRARWAEKKVRERRVSPRPMSPVVSPGDSPGDTRESPLGTPVGTPLGSPGTGSGSDPDLDPDNPEVTGIRVREFTLTPAEQDRVKAVLKPRVTRPATAMTEDWLPTDVESANSWHQEAGRKNFAADHVSDLVGAFRAYYTVGRGAKTKHVDWDLAWRNWLRKEPEYRVAGTRYQKRGDGVHQQAAAAGQEGWAPRGLVGAK